MKKINIPDISELFRALEIIRQFKFNAIEQGFKFVHAEMVFGEVLNVMKKGIKCPECQCEIQFFIKDQN